MIERTPWRLAVDALAVYRITRLVTKDDITQPARDRVIEAAYTWQGNAGRAREGYLRPAGRTGGVMEEGDWQHVVEQDEHPPKLATLITCRWCAGMYVALGLGLVVRRWRWWPTLADALALSAAGALIARLEDD